MSWLHNAGTALTSYNFRLLWVGRLCSHTGGGLHTVALSVVVLQVTGSSATALGIATMLGFLPTLVGGPWAGVWVDRWDAHRASVIQQCAAAALIALLAALTVTGVVQLWMVLTIALASGFSTLISNPLQQTLLGRLLPAQARTSGISLNSITFQAGQVVGALLGGLMVVPFGPGVLLVVAAGCYIPSVAGMLMMRRAEMHRAAPVTARRGQITEGLAHVKIALMPVFVASGVVALLGQGITTLAPVAATTTLGQGEAAVGWAAAAIGVGGALSQIMVAGITTPTMGHLLRRLAVLAVALLLAALAPYLWVLLAAMALAAWATFGHQTLAQSQLHAHTPTSMLGRVTALWFGVASGGKGLAGVMVGGLADLTSPPVAFAAMGIGVATAVTLLAHARRRWRLSRVLRRHLWLGGRTPRWPTGRHVHAAQPREQPAARRRRE